MRLLDELEAFAHANPAFSGSRGPVCVALIITDLARTCGLPLVPDALLTAQGGQVAGLSREIGGAILARHGIAEGFSSEWGRTSRGSIAHMRVYVALLNSINERHGPLESAQFAEIEAFWIARVRKFLENAPEALAHDAVGCESFETDGLRVGLSEFLNWLVPDYYAGGHRKVGDFRWGVYSFWDYDGEPIYVGQTNEKLRTRIRRHLTNQRTDAVAMSVLDPFEVKDIEVWPLPQYQETGAKDPEAVAHLNALECLVYRHALDTSRFRAILNEKEPPASDLDIDLPVSFRRCIVPEGVLNIRRHPDVRIARRALTISRLAQVISERKPNIGLRETLVTQAKRLRWLAERRFAAVSKEGVEVDD